MKLTATFAVLTIFVVKAVVANGATNALLQARAELKDDAIEEVWARFYDELLDLEDNEELFGRGPPRPATTNLPVPPGSPRRRHGKRSLLASHFPAPFSTPRLINEFRMTKDSPRRRHGKRSPMDDEELFERTYAPTLPAGFSE
ncbi:hypothetical protein BKA70DRAFT_1429126 [Coprinopsis sp. MPI-PUGE-AT-0042]|nr:hypothetical protein BKA70DRAFT_1429126 [Coprinopsis sp. MPI-PUGE-AT-0042]